MPENVIRVIWEGQDDLSRQADDVAASIAGATSAAEDGQGAFGGLGASLTGLLSPTNLAIGAVGGLAAGLVAGGKAAFDIASDIDQASDDIAAKLGITKEAAEGFEGVMKDVFANNFGEDFDDISSGVVALQQQLRELTPATAEGQQAMLEGAFAVRDAFGLELEETFQATSSLMREFGLTGQEAMNFVTAGLQQGLNASDDFLDTINEYSTQFSEGGADAAVFFNVMQSGLQGGALGTDKAADAFKEFRVRIQDGSKATSESLEAIGIDSEKLAARMADGSLTASSAFTMVLDALREVDDQNVLMQAGVGLLGTQFEDLGQDAVLALNAMSFEMETFEDATASLNQQYDSMGAVFEGVSRQIQIALVPLGDMLLDLANVVMPHITDFVSNQLVPGIERGVGFIARLFDAVRFGFEEYGVGLNGLLAGLGEFDFISDDFGKDFQPFIDAFDDALATATEVWPKVQALVNDALEFVQGKIEVVTGEISALWEEHHEDIQEIADLALTFYRELVEEITETVNGLMSGHGDTISEIVSGAWHIITELIDLAFEQIRNIFELGIALLQGDWETAWAEIGDILDTGLEAIIFVFASIVPALNDITQQAINAVNKKFSEFDWGSLGTAMKDGILGGISGLGESISSRVGGAFSGAMARIRRDQEGSSPFRLWAREVGEPLMQGIIMGAMDEAEMLGPLLNQSLIAAKDDVLRGVLPTIGGLGSGVGAGSGQMLANPLLRLGAGLPPAMGGGQIWNVNITSNAPVSTIRQDIELVKSMSMSLAL